MKKIIFLISILMLISACTTTNSVKRGSIKTIEQSVEKEVKNEQIKNSKETQIASMPDVSVFFPEETKENEKYSSSIWGIEKKSLYADSKASNVGDIVQVVIKESANAKIDYSKTKSGYTNYVGESDVKGTVFVKSNSKRGDFANISNPKTGNKGETAANSGKPAADAYNGTSSGKSSFAYQGTIAARVEGMDKFGNLFIKGTKTALVNNEIVVLELSGFVRPQDVKSDNTVDSELIDNMEFLLNGALYVRQPVITKAIGTNDDIIDPVQVTDIDTKKDTTGNGKSLSTKK